MRVKLVKAGYGEGGKPRTALAFRFLNGGEAKIGNSNYGNFRIADKRIYFRPEPEGIGYKLAKHEGKGNNVELRSSIHDIAKWEPFVGCYNLLYDHEVDLYYIERSKKL